MQGAAGQAEELRGSVRVDHRTEHFDELFYAHAGRLVRLAALLGDQDPEDVVQEAFYKLYAARWRLRGDQARVVPYLNRIVVNEVRSRHRHRAVARRDEHLLVEHRQGPDPAAALGDRSAVVAALASLPQRQREVLVLRFWSDLSIVAIADATGVRPGTVKSQLSRGLERLSELLREEVER